MTVEEMVHLLNGDLKNEYKHMHFYLYAAASVTGVERYFLSDVLKKHAESELEHCVQFATKIRSYGYQPAAGSDANPFEPKHTADGVLRYALAIEEEVVANYKVRRQQAEELGDTALVLILEEQIEDSQHDVDELMIALGGIPKVAV